MFLRILKFLPFFLVPTHSVRETTANVEVDVVEFDAVWVPADHAGPIVAAPLDDHIFKD